MRFSIVTPAYNMERWISSTIESVLSQTGDFDIEYIIVDDNSTDTTLEIVKSYIEKLKTKAYPIQCNSIDMRYITSSENKGMYESINQGFREAHGDIFAWINADDMYEPEAFKCMAEVFQTYPTVDWVKGITSTIDEEGKILKIGACKLYKQEWLASGIYGQESYFVEQDSVFWRKSLWDKAGTIPSFYRSAGDYWLWIQFAKISPLISLNKRISFFRKRAGQISKGISKYKYEQKLARPQRNALAWKARLFFSPQSRITKILPQSESFFIWLYPIIFGKPNAVYFEYNNGTIKEKKMKSYKII